MQSEKLLVVSTLPECWVRSYLVRVCALVLATLASTLVSFSQEKFYIEDCDGNITSPPDQSNHPTNVEWYVYFYRSSNGKRWGTFGPYKTSEKAFRVHQRNVAAHCRGTSGSGCILCDPELYCNGKVVAKIPLKRCMEQDAAELQLKDWLTRSRKSLKELLQPSQSGAMRNVGDVLAEYSRILSNVESKQRELNAMMLSNDDVHQLASEIDEFKASLQQDLSGYANDHIVSTQESYMARSKQLRDQTNGLIDVIQEITNKIIEPSERRRTEGEDRTQRIARQIEEEMRKEAAHAGTSPPAGAVDPTQDDTAASSLDAGSIGETPLFIHQPHPVKAQQEVSLDCSGFKARLKNKCELEISGSTEYTGIVTVYIDNDVVAEKATEAGSFTMRITVSKKYNTGHRVVKIVPSDGRALRHCETNLLRY